MMDEPTNAADYHEPERPWTAWSLTIIGVGSILTAAGIAIRAESHAITSETSPSAMARLFLTVGGAFAIGIAISMRPADPNLLGLACLGAVLARVGVHPAWDALRILAGFAAIVSGIAALLMAMPRPVRRVGVSLLLLFHFGGIFVVAAHAPDGESAWTVQAGRFFVYRPYLQFIHLDSGYGFFWREPISERLKWFCIEYEDGSKHWHKMPQRLEKMSDPLGLRTARYIEMAYYSARYSADEPSDDVKKERVLRAEGKNAIPFHPARSTESQYRPPENWVRDHVLPSMVRHLCKERRAQHPDGMSRIKSVKVYDVVHRILRPGELQATGFYDPHTYELYYQGEFDPDGNEINLGDPMRHWLVPVFYESKSGINETIPNVRERPEDYILIDGLKRHTGSSPFE
jgi:hypothetical protein